VSEQIQTPPAPEADRPAGGDGDTLLEATDLVRHFPVTRGVVFRRKVGAVQAVDGINLSVTRGQTLGLVGESGCGKTTTGRLLVRLDEPTSGRIVIDGHDVTHLRQGQMRPLRREIQMIFQDPYSSLNPRHTVGGIVGAPFRLQKVNVPGGVKRNVQELLELVGLNPEHYNRYPHEFSGGQRQRIGIARTLALRPKLIVADEPVSALDVSIQAQVINLLEDLQDELGLTYVVIAHDLSVVRHISDRAGGGHVPGQDRRARRPGQAVRQAAAPVHGGAAVGGSGTRAAQQRHGSAGTTPAHQAGGRRTEPAAAAARVPLPHPVLEGAADLPHHRAAAGRADPWPPGGVPLPGEHPAGVRELSGKRPAAGLRRPGVWAVLGVSS